MDSILLPTEIEMYVDTMQPQTMDNLGTKQWLDWHQRMQKLNQEALIEAASVKEEYVKETLVCFKKVKILVHEAILISIWKHKVLPQLLKLEPKPQNTFVAYSILYHEAICVALLELVMYHTDCCEALEDFSADLLDYLHGTISQLLVIKPKEPQNSESSNKELLRQKNDLAFDIGIRSLSIIRYLAENIERLPLNVYSRMYTHHDMPVLMTELVMAQPWVRKKKQYTGGKWKEWDGERLGQPQAQVWLTLRQLLLDPECTKYYDITENRKNTILKLLPKMQASLLDQLSPLIELKHWLCKLSCTEGSAECSRPILMEIVLEIKQAILKECREKWKKIAEKQLDVMFPKNKETLRELAQQLTDAYNLDLLEKMEIKDDNVCQQCGKGAIQRCSRCKKTWYCSRACQVTHWPQHKEYCSV